MEVGPFPLNSNSSQAGPPLSSSKLPTFRGWAEDWVQDVNGGAGVESLSNGQKCGLCRSGGVLAGRNECQQKCFELLACSLAALSCWGPLSMSSHFCEQQEDTASFSYNQAHHTRTDTLALESPQNTPTKYPAWHLYNVYREARVVFSLWEPKFPPRRPETEAIWSGLHKGTFFWVIQRITSSFQPFGFNGVVNFQKRFQWPI